MPPEHSLAQKAIFPEYMPKEIDADHGDERLALPVRRPAPYDTSGAPLV